MRLYREGSHPLFRSPLDPLIGDARLRGVLESIAGEMESGAAGWREVVGSLVNQLAVYLLRAHVNVQRSDEIELSRVEWLIAVCAGRLSSCTTTAGGNWR